MKAIDPAAEGALEDPASTYADCRAVVERGLAELQVRSLPPPCVISAGQCCMMQKLMGHIKCCLLASAAPRTSPGPVQSVSRDGAGTA